MPPLWPKSGKNFTDVIREICAAGAGPVSAEAVSDYDGMLREGFVLREIAKHVTLQVPPTADWLRSRFNHSPTDKSHAALLADWGLTGSDDCLR